MLNIIFGNIARKDHYYLNKSNIKKMELKVMEKFFFFNLRSIGSSWTQDRPEPEADPSIGLEPDPNIHPTYPRPLG